MPTAAAFSPLFEQRRAGVLLHPTSLPAQGGLGNLGREAYYFVDFLVASGLSIWQMLPIGPTHSDLSPYQSLSSHAGNPELIAFDWLADQQWFPQEVLKQEQGICAKEHRQKIAQYFFAETLSNNAVLRKSFDIFCEAQQHWLPDYTLFQALREHFHGLPWNQWPTSYRQRDQDTLDNARKSLSPAIERALFEQFTFFQQWQSLRSYAHKRGVYLFGDLPIFVAHDSADVWLNQSQFMLDEQGSPLTVAGVPPDYFSETGQHWGNPHYRWNLMQKDGFSWWLSRIGAQLQLFDLIRIDHFRAFDAFWEIPGTDPDARNGRWVSAPGKALLKTLFKAFHPLPLVAENLGVITLEVEALRKVFNLPGMLVLQFGFDGNSANPHLPHNHQALDVVYTGTHDNDTTLGWFQKLDAQTQQQVRDYLASPTEPMPELLIKSALASVSKLAIIPMQDLLALDSSHRMNTPGTVGQNWQWQFSWAQVPESLATRLRHWLSIYGRLI